MTADLLRILLALFLAAMYALAILFLRRRQMSLMAYISWGAFALLIPIIGPFLVILVRPGKRRSAPDRAPETGLP